MALLSRIAEPRMVVSDGGSGFEKILRQTRKHTKHQRCIFHVFSQVRRYTTSSPKSLALMELYILAKNLLHLKNKAESQKWVHRFIDWMEYYLACLNQITVDENVQWRPTHDCLVTARNSLIRLDRDETYLHTWMKSCCVQLRRSLQRMIVR